ncbi:MAG: methyltransferase domain-containing protein [Lentisphaerae bacterium]|jgi:SAM-dependent methyltransferase|nr:methyltransferase domain-containing protein [Lentisphaerota bacterium]MBT4816075.1 methyltransferase domain-containing protein [Lentisphaerota bacterium]MBT5613160.1 methyltransferase domain-containing protein [Lentisphaerota bacterium]MBT7061944.1 methyltransferase domain-containing protein [Lentisphaerota bacterium]MBT7844548.1 methyltransferase domain-containing protein [Lentisphaerota bacterium]
MNTNTQRYWDTTADEYQRQTRISCTDFHYGPLLPGDGLLQLLPWDVAGMACLELGAGAAQNSLYLASRGAACTAVDISERQLEVGRTLAGELGLEIELVQGDLEALPFQRHAAFDLIHSVYALPFVDDQEAVIRTAATLLTPGGVLLLSTAHPLANAEWLAVDDDETGIFLQDYFVPPVDARVGESEGLPEGGVSACCPAPLSHVFKWLRDAGLEVLDFLEPEPLAVENPDEHPGKGVPYDSPEWRERFEELARIPVVAIFRARKPEQA